MLLCQGGCEVAEDEVVESAGECSLEAAPGLSLGFAFGASFLDVAAGFVAAA
jgi:hypothetical protein